MSAQLSAQLRQVLEQIQVHAYADCSCVGHADVRHGRKRVERVCADEVMRLTHEALRLLQWGDRKTRVARVRVAVDDKPKGLEGAHRCQSGTAMRQCGKPATTECVLNGDAYRLCDRHARQWK